MHWTLVYFIFEDNLFVQRLSNKFIYKSFFPVNNITFINYKKKLLNITFFFSILGIQ